jgi:predicted aldo/keto reductase-like oxidoreductase
MSENLFDLNPGKLGFGFMRLPRAEKGFDSEQIMKMVDAYMESGNRYFDTAFVYRGSERELRKTLVDRYPRDSFLIATKINLGNAESREQLPSMWETSIERLGVDYVDFYMIHGIGNRTGTKDDDLGAWDYLKELKAAGKVKHIGCSFHGTPDKLESVLEKHPECEFVQLQINYLDWDDKDVQSRGLYDVARKYKVPVIIMEPVKGGMLSSEGSPISKIYKAANPNASLASWALRFAMSLDGVFVTLSGMSDMGQMEDNLNTTKNFKPLTEDELKTIHEAVNVLNSVPRVPCTECEYCLEGCEAKIHIPEMMDILSDYMVHQAMTNLQNRYHNFAGPAAKNCTQCRKCEETCPQGIGIVENLEKLSALFD